MKPTHITVTNVEFYEVLRDDAEAGETNWTVNRHARRGHRMLVYVCAPVSAVVAVATLATDATQDEDPASEWFGYFLADMHSLRMLREPLKREYLRAIFPAWGYWKQPRNSVRVPEHFQSRLESLLID